MAFTIDSFNALFWLFCTRSIDSSSLSSELSLSCPEAIFSLASDAGCSFTLSGSVFLSSSASSTSPTSSFLSRASSFCSMNILSLLASSSDFLALISPSILLCVLERLTPSFSLSLTAFSTYTPSWNHKTRLSHVLIQSSLRPVL